VEQEKILRGDDMNAKQMLKKTIFVLLVALVASGLLTTLINVQPALASVSWNF
jgi:hypothetical protein